MSDGVNRCALSIAWLKQNQGERRAKPFPSYTGIWSLRLPSYKRAQGLFHRTRAFGLFCRLGLFFRLRSFHRTQVLLASIVQGPLVSSVDTVRTKCCFLPAPPAHPPPSILYGQAARKASYGDVHRASVQTHAGKPCAGHPHGNQPYETVDKDTGLNSNRRFGPNFGIPILVSWSSKRLRDLEFSLGREASKTQGTSTRNLLKNTISSKMLAEPRA